MSSELGRLEKPPAEQFQGERRIYLVPLVFAPRKPAPDYADMFERYWSGVREHLMKLEHSMGAIAHVYHESVGLAGEDGVAMAERLSEKSASIARNKVENLAGFEALEDQELVVESIDWQRCLMIGLESQKAGEYVWKSYSEAMKKRYEIMAQRIDDSLGAGEAGLLFITEEHHLQFPAGVRVFYVSPPALDEIHRWLRDHRGGPAEEEPREGEQDG